MDQEQLLRIFVTESEELLGDLEQGLVALEDGSRDPDIINRVFRAAHTIKGNAGMANVEELVRFSHVMENVLDLVRAEKLAVSSDLITVLLACVDCLRDLVSAVDAGTEVVLTPAHEAVLERLRPFIPAAGASKTAGAGATEQSGPRVFEVDMRFREDIFETGQDPGLLVHELHDIGEVISVAADISKVPPLDALDPCSFHIGWKALVRTEQGRAAVDSVFVFVADENQISISDVTSTHHNGVDIQAADKKIGELLVEAGAVREKDIAAALSQQRRLGDMLVEQGTVKKEVLQKVLSKQETARKARQASSIRVDTDKLDRLVNLVGELVIAVAQVNQKTRDAQATQDAILGSVEALEQISRDLQEQVMTVRMVPVKETFDRFKRAVRDLATELGKYVVLDTSGTETELDKNVIEQLVDPLKHMIRNCVSHGIEMPAERIASGKSDTGRIQLRALQREGNIFIEVSDDGRGIDPDAVLDKARAKGMIPEGKTLTQKEVFDLLFEPGFSTAAQVNEVSGRGVGLDVVKRNIQELRGSVEVESDVGKGTMFRIRLPLTLAIIDGMNVRVGRETVTIPLLSVVELLEPHADVIKTVEGKGEVVDVRGEVLPMLRLGHVFDFGVERYHDRDAKVVVVENEGHKFGMLVDKVVGMEQAVIKPLDRSFMLFGRIEDDYERPEGIAGATILGDGSVGLILDVGGIERMAFGAAS